MTTTMDEGTTSEATTSAGSAAWPATGPAAGTTDRNEGGVR